MHNFPPGNIRSVVFDIFDRFFFFCQFTMRSLLFHTIVVWMLLFGRALCVNVQCMILLPINHKKQINPIQCVIFVQTPSDLSGTLPQSWRKHKPNVLIKMWIFDKMQYLWSSNQYRAWPGISVLGARGGGGVNTL